jgi:holliday junction resolvase YEN1
VLLFRLFSLLRAGILPFFVFDGPNKPTWKRGNHVGGGWRDGKDKTFKELLDLMGMPWRTAPGEAEAELAACAKRGEIDGVLTVSIGVCLSVEYQN